MISSFIPLIGLKFSESIFFEFRSVFIYLLSKNITIIKKNIFNKSFYSEKSWIRILKVNITSLFQEFYSWFFFCFITFLSFLINLNRDTKL